MPGFPLQGTHASGMAATPFGWSVLFSFEVFSSGHDELPGSQATEPRVGSSTFQPDGYHIGMSQDPNHGQFYGTRFCNSVGGLVKVHPSLHALHTVQLVPMHDRGKNKGPGGISHLGHASLRCS